MVWHKNWNDEQIAKVKKLAEVDKLTSPEIAAMLGITKGSVSGICHREGIKLGQKPKKPPKPMKMFFGKPRVQTPVLSSTPLMQHPADVPGATSMATAKGCMFVLGDPRFYLVCNHQLYRGGPYCRDHALVCFNQRRGAA
jgi:hypothetical protein